jgi:sugar phosphate isomerase/epimerase
MDVWDALEQSGVAGVELGTPPQHFDPWKDDEVAALAARQRSGGPRIISIHAPFGGLLDLADPNPYHRYAAIGAIMAAGRALKRLGGSIVVVHPSDRVRQADDVQQRLENCRDSLKSLGAACRHESLQLTVESPLPHLIGGHVDEFTWLLASLDPSVGVCLDTGHIALGRAWPAFLAASQGRLRHIHASDNHGQYDDHLPPGDGSIDWPAIRRSLVAVNFQGWVMLELRCPKGSLAEDLGRAMRQAGGLLGS